MGGAYHPHPKPPPQSATGNWGDLGEPAGAEGYNTLALKREGEINVATPTPAKLYV